MTNALSTFVYYATRPEAMAGAIGCLLLSHMVGTFTFNGTDLTSLFRIVVGTVGFFLFSRAWISYESHRIHAAHDKYAADEHAA